jgi:MFS family permease
MNVIDHNLVAALALVSPITALIIGPWLLRALDTAALRKQKSPSFMMSDLLSLIFHLAFPLSLGANYSSENDESQIGWLILVFVLMAIVGAVWWFGIRTLSSAGVADPNRRNLFVAMILPAAFLGALFLNPLGLAVCLTYEFVYQMSFWLMVLTVFAMATPFLTKYAIDWVLRDPGLDIHAAQAIRTQAARPHPLDADA